MVPQLNFSAGELKFYSDEGYLLLPGLLAEADAAKLAAEVLDIVAKTGLPVTKLKQSHEYLEGGCLDALINSRELRSLAEQLMGGPATLYLPFTAVKSAGGGRFHFHQDNNYTPFDGPGINLWLALAPMSPENGCLQVV